LTSNAWSSVDATMIVAMMLSGTIGTSTQTSSVPNRALSRRNPASSVSPIDNGRSWGVNEALDKIPPWGTHDPAAG
jgi:hypothetical protein